jgi:acyl carrier protein
MDKLELFNAVIRVTRPASDDSVKANSLDESFQEIGIDSMDVIMMSIYFSDIYGVDEEIAKTLLPQNPRQFFEMYESIATKHPQSVEEAIKSITP